MSKEVKPTLVGIELEAELPTEMSFNPKIGSGNPVMVTLREAVIKSVEKAKLSTDFKQPEIGIDGAGDILELRFPAVLLSEVIDKYQNIDKIISILRVDYNLNQVPHKAGMHVHLDRTFMNADSFMRMAKFIKKEAIFVGTFSERKQRMIGYVNPNVTVLSREASGFSNGQGSDNCLRLNCPVGDKYTIEFRLFCGTLNTNKFLANAMFAERLATFCNEETEQRKLTRLNFISFVKNSGFVFRPLLTDMESKGLTEKVLEVEEKIEMLTSLLVK